MKNLSSSNFVKMNLATNWEQLEHLWYANIFVQLLVQVLISEELGERTQTHYVHKLLKSELLYISNAISL